MSRYLYTQRLKTLSESRWKQNPNVPTTFLLRFCHGKRSRYDIIRHHTTIRPWIRDMVWSQDLPRSTEPPSRAFAQNCPDLTNVKTCQNQSIGQSRSIKTMVTICYHGSAMLFLESLYHFRITITGPYWNWIDWWKLLQRLRSGQSMLITSSCRSTWHNYAHLCTTNIAHHRSSYHQVISEWFPSDFHEVNGQRKSTELRAVCYRSTNRRPRRRHDCQRHTPSATASVCHNLLSPCCHHEIRLNRLNSPSSISSMGPWVFHGSRSVASQ